MHRLADDVAEAGGREKVPPVKGFWSLTLCNDRHLFNANPLNRFSLGTKNKTLQYNADGSLTLYAGATSPGKNKETKLVAGTCWEVLALPPSLLGGES